VGVHCLAEGGLVLAIESSVTWFVSRPCPAHHLSHSQHLYISVCPPSPDTQLNNLQVVMTTIEPKEVAGQLPCMSFTTHSHSPQRILIPSLNLPSQLTGGDDDH
jgi:hypothetical protein